MSQIGVARRGRVTDQRPWWDTFPWWSLIILSVLGWMGWQILTNDNYELAWERILPGLGLTITSTIQAFAIALVIALIIAMGQMSRNVVFRNTTFRDIWPMAMMRAITRAMANAWIVEVMVNPRPGRMRSQASS